jgi:hypothetical protein
MHGFKDSDCENEITNILNTVYHAGNYSAIDNFSIDITTMTLKSFQSGKHPVINQRNFFVNVLPVPNMTIFNHSTGSYTGVRFNTHCSTALDLFSINKNFDTRSFITVEELKRMKLDGNIKHEDQISIIIKNQWINNKNNHNSNSDGFTSIRVVNIESFLKSVNNPNGCLDEKEFNMYFPDFGKQIIKYQNYSNKFIELMQDNVNRIGNSDYSNKQITIDTKNSYLPKLSAEMANYQFCRLTMHEYIPKFSKEDHLTDIINLHRKNHELLKTAITQSCHFADISINRLLDNKKTDTITKIVEQKQKVKVHERKLTYQ